METFFYYLAAAIISYIIATALQPKPAIPKPATLEDFDFPQVDEGTPQTVIFGDCWTSGWMVLSYGNLRTEEVKA